MVRIANHRLIRLLLATGLCVFFPACSRHWFRKKADEEAHSIIQEKGGHLDRGTIYPKADSRLHDPNAVDCPPMPSDDPASNQLMRCVDGKPGYDGWDQNGHVSKVEPDFWRQSLPTDENGQVSLNLQDAVRVARVHSRPYQGNLETLYLSALDVSFERFNFVSQFFAGTGIDQEFNGRNVGASSETTLNSAAGLQKLSATGGQLVVGLANSLLWDSWGSGSDLFTSTIDFSLVQPLLRLGGRSFVLESLTQSERNLLANVRQMQQFRQGFYVEIATGRNSGPGPSLGNSIGQAGLGLIAGFPGGRNGAPSAGGYLGLLTTQQEIRNQMTNITALRDSLAQLEAAFAANRINSRFQIDQARQALLDAQSILLSSRASYESRVDAFKVDLGLPPDLQLQIKDDFLDRFVLIDPELTELQNAIAEILTAIRKQRDTPTNRFVDDTLDDISELDELVQRLFLNVENDLEKLNDHLPDRKDQLERVAEQISELDADVDSRVYDKSTLQQRIEFLQKQLPKIGENLRKNAEDRVALAKTPESNDDAQSTKSEDERDVSDADTEKDADDPEAKLLDQLSMAIRLQEAEQPKKSKSGLRWDTLNRLATEMSNLLLELSLVHAEVRLQGISLLPIDIESTAAMDAARLHRLDWKNARANLVDSWRQIQVLANGLKSDLDIFVDGQIATRPDNVLDFDDDRSRIRLGIQFDTPLARLAERNQYRAALIEYQQARREYMLFEDQISQSLRNTIRLIKLSQINLEVRRAAVQVAITQVDIARLRLNPPLKPGQNNQTSPTAARDLVDALTDLLDAQNDMLNVWVSYEVLRVLLDFEMGTMQLNASGDWIDPGPIQQRSSTRPPQGETLDELLEDELLDEQEISIDLVPPDLL